MRLNTRFEYTKYKAGGGYNLVRQSENDTHRHRADGWLALADWLMFFFTSFLQTVEIRHVDGTCRLVFFFSFFFLLIIIFRPL